MCSQAFILIIIPIIVVLSAGTSIFIVGRVGDSHELSVTGIAIIIVTVILVLCIISSCIQSGCCYREPNDIEMAVHRQAEVQYIQRIENQQQNRPIIERSDSARDIYNS